MDDRSRFVPRAVAPGHPAVEAKLRERTRERRQITFAEFMRIALYDPDGGYYVRHGPGRDFETAPRISPAFAHLLARAVALMWESVGRPSRFDVVELGGGRGELAAGILAYLRARQPSAAAAVRYTIVDRGLTNRGLIRGGAAASGVQADAAALPLRSLIGCVLSNELFDALPVHRVVGYEGGIGELWVEPRDGGWAFVPGQPSDPALVAYLGRVDARLAEGQIADVSVLAPRVYAEACGRLQQGYVLTIDYGGGAADLFAPHRREGTLVAYHRHRASNAPLDRPGEQDLTAHVDFTALRLAGESAGLATLADTTQREFLLGLGLRDWLSRLDPARLTPADLFNARIAAEELVRSDRLGKFRVLLQARGVDVLPVELVV